MAKKKKKVISLTAHVKPLITKLGIGLGNLRGVWNSHTSVGNITFGLWNSCGVGPLWCLACW